MGNPISSGDVTQKHDFIVLDHGVPMQIDGYSEDVENKTVTIGISLVRSPLQAPIPDAVKPFLPGDGSNEGG